MRKANHHFLAGAVLALMMICLCAVALADYGVVQDTATLNVRTGPGTNYSLITSVKKGEWVEITGQQNNWYSVRLIDSTVTGYMSKNFLGTIGSASSNTAVVANPRATSFLNLREYPSYSANVLGIYYNGATCTIISEADGWCYVNIGGLYGYFRYEYLQRTNGSDIMGGTTAYTTSANGKKVNLRSEPTYNSAVLKQLPVGTQVSVLLKGNKFWQVSYSGTVGFMDCTYLTTSSGGGGGGGGGTTTGGYAIVSNPKSTQLLYFRAQPSKTAKVLGQYYNGTRLEVVQQGKTWCKVKDSASGTVGYMMTQYLTLYNLPATPQKTVSNNGSYVNLRSSPSKSGSTVYARVPSGRTVIVMTPGDTWAQVKYGDITGYMMNYFLK